MKEKDNLSGIINIFCTVRSNIDELQNTDLSKLNGVYPEFDFNSKITKPVNALRREIVNKQSWVGEDYYKQICDYCEKLLTWIDKNRHNPTFSYYTMIRSSVRDILSTIYELGRRAATQDGIPEKQDTSQTQKKQTLGSTMADGDNQVRKDTKSSIASYQIMTKFGLRI